MTKIKFQLGYLSEQSLTYRQSKSITGHPINPAIIPNQSEEEKSFSVSAGILAKVVSHLLTVDLRKEDDDAGKDLGIIPEIQAPTDPAIVPKQSEEIITSSSEAKSTANVVSHLQAGIIRKEEYDDRDRGITPMIQAQKDESVEDASDEDDKDAGGDNSHPGRKKIAVGSKFNPNPAKGIKSKRNISSLGEKKIAAGSDQNPSKKKRSLVDIPPPAKKKDEYSNIYGSLKVKELREKLRKRDLKVSGIKIDLLERLRQNDKDQVPAGILVRAVSHLQTVNLRKERNYDDDDLEGEVILENPSLYIRSPINPAIMPNQSEEEKSSSVSAGILAKVVSHLTTVNLRKEEIITSSRDYNFFK